MNNKIKTVFLLGLLSGLVMFIGQQFGGHSGLMMALFFSLAMNMGAYWFSDKLALAMNGAKPVTEAELPQVYRMVRSLAERAKVPMPRIYLIESTMLNAFATGRNPEHAAVAVTQGILERLSEKELEGVLGHELSHVIHRDTLISTVAASLASAITFIARSAMWFGGAGRDRDNRNPMMELLLVMLAPVAAFLIQMAISRSREYDADRGGAALTGDPLALASALGKISGTNDKLPPLTDNPTFAHLYISNPLKGEGLFQLFSTHPPIPERIKRLQAMTPLTGGSTGAGYNIPQVIR